MIFGRFVYDLVYKKLKSIPDFNALRQTTENEINDKMNRAFTAIFNMSDTFDFENIADYNLEDFVGMIGLFAKTKSQYSKMKFGIQMDAKLNAIKKQLISEGKLSITGKC
jgi:hypothetical protein